MSATLYGLGVGPGDPELITLKALRLLRACPVIAWPAPDQGDSLARAIVADHLPGGQIEIAIRIPMAPGHALTQTVYDAAAAEIAGHLSAGRDVACICVGDPFFYGSFMYLFGRLAQSHKVEVVPGVSSLTACAAAVAAPLAGLNDVLSVIPAPIDEDAMAQRLADADAAAIIKVGRHLGKVRRVIERLGLMDRARYVERATMQNQRLMPLAEVPDDAAPYFSMVLVHQRGEAWR
jgi:precorrin-2/cobalt-factor-2 C20-methyltransferase